MLRVRQGVPARTCWNVAITVRNLDVRATLSGQPDEVAVHHTDADDGVTARMWKAA